MDAIDQRALRALQRLRRSDIGEDHKFLDNPVRIKSLAFDNSVDAAIIANYDFALRQFEIEGRAFCALFHAQFERGVEMFDPALLIVGRIAAISDILRIIVRKLCCRAHHGAHKAMPLQNAIGIDCHFGRKAGAIFIRTQRTQIIRKAFG